MQNSQAGAAAFVCCHPSLFDSLWAYPMPAHLHCTQSEPKFGSGGYVRWKYRRSLSGDGTDDGTPGGNPTDRSTTTCPREL
jgi:hypothetical protein